VLIPCFGPVLWDGYSLSAFSAVVYILITSAAKQIFLFEVLGYGAFPQARKKSRKTNGAAAVILLAFSDFDRVFLESSDED
jgi:hypothetical protein